MTQPRTYPPVLTATRLQQVIRIRQLAIQIRAAVDRILADADRGRNVPDNGRKIIDLGVSLHAAQAIAFADETRTRAAAA